MPAIDPTLIDDVVEEPMAAGEPLAPRKKREKKTKAAAIAANDERIAAAIGAMLPASLCAGSTIDISGAALPIRDFRNLLRVDGRRTPVHSFRVPRFRSS